MKTVLITGGLGDIGQAIFSSIKSTMLVVVIDRLDDKDQRAVDLMHQGGIYVQADLGSSESIHSAFQKIFSYLDERQMSLDVLINNAGITRDNLVLRMSEDQWDTVQDVNLKGAFLCCQHALKRMIKQQKSYIVNVSSVVGICGNPGQANYAASKAGLIALTQTLAQEYARRGVRVNAVAPGFITTSMTDSLPEHVKVLAKERIALRSFGSPSDVASLIQFLVSGQADYITGQVVRVDGGMY